MCGIAGIVRFSQKGVIDNGLYKNIFKDLLLFSETRGKEASGFALQYNEKIFYHKIPRTASFLVKSKDFNNAFDTIPINTNGGICAIGHSRLVTNGYEHENTNNQPVIKNNSVCIHNGIIVNEKFIWETNSNLKKETELDSELIPVLLTNYYESNNQDILIAFKKLFEICYGVINTALYFELTQNLFLTTNNGSLYYYSNENCFGFASELGILKKVINKYKVLGNPKIHQLKPHNLLIINFLLNEVKLFELDKEIEICSNDILNKNKIEAKNIQEISFKPKGKSYINTSLEHLIYHPIEKFNAHVEKCEMKISKLKRCTCCILPETFPFIEFDDKGVCNYCNNHKKIQIRGIDQFSKLFENKRNISGYDCLIPFSGGRDSSYLMHVAKKDLGINPIAFSYDWGMLTDLARRNQSRMCSKLGIEHILVSADIRSKRKNIQRNVIAWLKGPKLGTIPLFMAGDKQYFYYSNKLMKEHDLTISLMGENMLEATRFKTGFCGVQPFFDADHNYTIPISGKLKMLFYYFKEYALNPAYINRSLFDTFDAFKSYYIIKHQTVNLFDYLVWDEKVINNILINEYDWEIDPETPTTWRIGDGTVAFYNYIYYMVSGFTENDTFRSNQIREGMLTREEAIEKVRSENKPRWNSIAWYCNTIGIGIEDTIEIINKIKPLYEKL